MMITVVTVLINVLQLGNPLLGRCCVSAPPATLEAAGGSGSTSAVCAGGGGNTGKWREKVSEPRRVNYSG